MRKTIIPTALLAAFLAAVLFAGCSEGVFTGDPEDNDPPEIWLSSGPVQGDTTGYQVHFYWSGWDPDGEVQFYEFSIVEGDPIGFTPADTAGLDKWTRTSVHDSVFRVKADGNPRIWEENTNYTRFDRTHTFFIRAVDLQGKRSVAADRSFTAWTLAPIVRIDKPIGVTRTYSTVITFAWTGTDPIDGPSNIQEPDSIRYLWTQVLNKDGVYQPDFLIIDDMNENPQDYEEFWGPWIHYRADGDSGRTTILGDDEILEINRSHIFALQAKDDAGAVTATFVRDRNVRQFLVSFKTGPLLTVTEPFLGGFQFLGPDMNFVQKDLPPGVELNFKWSATAEDYGGEIQSYRYGWDVQQLDDPTEWDVNPSPFITAAEPKTFFSGIHNFLVEVVDNGQRLTYGKVQVNIIPFSMDKNLLWVDDYPLGAPIPVKTDPGEEEHDEFWTEICGRTIDFRPDRDIYDVASANNEIPKMRLIGQYANIVWTYSSSITTAWGNLIKFTPESQVGTGAQLRVNFLALFLAKGGHLMTSGRADRAGGGLIEAFQSDPLLPVSLKFDMAGTSSEDTSGVNSMPYRDYCVSIIDKVAGQFRSGDEMAPGYTRSLDNDGVRFLTKWDEDPDENAILAYPEFPETLDLSDEVTCPTCFFDPSDRGFSYMEVYDPDYWKVFKQITSQSCFHPMYRMKALSTKSAVHDQPVALILTKYREKFEADIAAGKPVDVLPANSFHFGFPLWFFDHDKVDAIVDAIFREWEIFDDSPETS